MYIGKRNYKYSIKLEVEYYIYSCPDSWNILHSYRMKINNKKYFKESIKGRTNLDSIAFLIKIIGQCRKVHSPILKFVHLEQILKHLLIQYFFEYSHFPPKYKYFLHNCLDYIKYSVPYAGKSTP